MLPAFLHLLYRISGWTSARRKSRLKKRLAEHRLQMAESRRKEYEEKEKEARAEQLEYIRKQKQLLKENYIGDGKRRFGRDNWKLFRNAYLYGKRVALAYWFKNNKVNSERYEKWKDNYFPNDADIISQEVFHMADKQYSAEFEQLAYKSITDINWPECAGDLIERFNFIGQYGIDVAKCDSTRLVLRSMGKVADIDDWKKYRRQLNLFLERDVELEMISESEIAIVPVDLLPSLFEFNNKYLQHGYLFFGLEARTAKPYYVALKDMPHMLVIGISGMGKSVFLNQLIQGMLYNLRYIEKIYMVDFKGGVELFPYEKKSDKIRVIYRYEELAAVVSELLEKMYERLERMRKAGVRKWEGSLIFFIVDEYAQIQLYRPADKASKEKHLKLLADLNSLSMMGRGAGVRILAQIQKGTTDVMDSSFRNNLQSQICFKVKDNLTASGMFGSVEGLPAEPTKLRRGRFIFYDDSIGNTVYLQAAVVPEEFEVQPYEPIEEAS